jgi:CRISPR system Cascade subunit CasC
MTTFIQLHLLTSYPPANLNRDDLGRPKTAVMGGAQRLRISSQSLKRAWRTSELFQQALAGHVGTRTKDLGRAVYTALAEGRPLADVLTNTKTEKLLRGVDAATAKEVAKKIASVFGELEDKSTDDPLKELQIKQLCHLGPDEISAVGALVEKLRNRSKAPTQEDLELLRAQQSTVDIALFGRMLAAKPGYNQEAAAQVAHAITVHKVAVEDDYFTAVDDLNRGEEDMGAGHIGETEFAAGLFYLYVCIDRDLLCRNLQDDEALTAKTLRALTEVAATVAPSGKQSSFASRAYASYIVAEKGTRQPRSLSVAFLKPVFGQDMLTMSVAALEETRANMEKVYGPLSDVAPCVVNATTGEGGLASLLKFVSEPLPEKKGTR